MTTTTELKTLVREAAYYGVTLRTSADPEDGTPEYIVNGPINAPALFSSADTAATELTNRITSITDATEAAMRRAEQWADVRATAADDVEAWRTLATSINEALPAGCDIPTPDVMDVYGVSGWGTITSAVARALAEWTAANRDRTARTHLEDALKAEGSELIDAAEQVSHRLDYWEAVVELWRPVQIVREPGDRLTLRRGRVLVDTDTRRNIAWRHFGVVTPVGKDAVDTSVEQIDRARDVVADVAERHRSEADRLAGKMRL